MARQVHKSTDGLPDEAVRILIGGFRARKTYAAIARDLAEIGAEVPERTIARRASEWRQAQERRDQAREYVHDLVAAMKSQDMRADEMVQALATEAVLSDPEAFTSGDPIKLQGLNIRAQANQLKAQELAIRERLLTMEEQRLRLLTAREERAKAALAKPEGQMTPEQRLQEVRDIYGIRPAEGARA
jgi:hypothetical protein